MKTKRDYVTRKDWENIIADREDRDDLISQLEQWICGDTAVVIEAAFREDNKLADDPDPRPHPFANDPDHARKLDEYTKRRNNEV